MAVVTMVTLASCIQPAAREPYDPYAEGPPEQGLHGIDPQRLHYLMAKLSEMHLDQMPPEALDDPQPDPNLIRAAGMGEAMVADARSLPGIAGEGMSAGERRTLNRYASIYLDLARELAKADERQDVPRVRRTLYSVTRTCNECHVAVGGPHFAFDQGVEESTAPAPNRRARPAPDEAPSRNSERRPEPERRPPIEPSIDDDL